MPRLPIPSDTEAFSEETRAAVRHILTTRKSMPHRAAISRTPGKPERCSPTSSTTCATTRR